MLLRFCVHLYSTTTPQYIIFAQCIYSQNQTAENKPHLFPFMLAEHSNNHVLSKLYHQVKTAMLAVHSAQASQESVDALLKVAEEW